MTCIKTEWNLTGKESKVFNIAGMKYYPEHVLEMLRNCLIDDFVEMFGIEHTSRIIDLFDKRMKGNFPKVPSKKVRE